MNINRMRLNFDKEKKLQAIDMYTTNMQTNQLE